MCRRSSPLASGTPFRVALRTTIVAALTHNRRRPASADKTGYLNTAATDSEELRKIVDRFSERLRFGNRARADEERDLEAPRFVCVHYTTPPPGLETVLGVPAGRAESNSRRRASAT